MSVRGVSLPLRPPVSGRGGSAWAVCRAWVWVSVVLVAAVLVGGGDRTAVRPGAQAVWRAETRAVSGVGALRRLAGLSAVISRTLAADRGAFRAVRTAVGWRLGGGGVAAEFGRGWVRVRAAGGSVSLSLAGVGYGRLVRSLGSARLVAVGIA